MLKHVEKVKEEALVRFGKKQLKPKLDEVLAAFKTWDYRFDLDNHLAPLFNAWEFHAMTNMHSYKVRDRHTRLAMVSVHLHDEFFYVELEKWHNEGRQEYCRQLEFDHLDQTDNCLYLLTYGLVEAIEETIKQQGPDINNWALSKSQHTHFEH